MTETGQGWRGWSPAGRGGGALSRASATQVLWSGAGVARDAGRQFEQQRERALLSPIRHVSSSTGDPGSLRLVALPVPGLLSGHGPPPTARRPCNGKGEAVASLRVQGIRGDGIAAQIPVASSGSHYHTL